VAYASIISYISSMSRRNFKQSGDLADVATRCDVGGCGRTVVGGGFTSGGLEERTLY
jgi:hypothetical protein